MKKFISTMLTVIMVLLLCIGCSNTKAQNTATTESTATESTTTKTTDATATTPAASDTMQKAEATTTKAEPVELTILAAASLTDATTKIAELYKTVAPNVTLTFSYGASGALQTQIEEGAPADLFMSAAPKQMNALDEKGLLLADTRKDLLLNKIVLITPKDSSLGLTSFEDVSTDKVKTIALGEPAGVPVGQYAEQVFTSLGTLDAVKAKANYGSDVKQVLSWVESGEVDCGVVYATDAKTSDKVSVVCEAPEGSHDAVVYPAAVIASSTSPDDAKAFLDYLSSDEAKAVFVEYGFTMK
jgi:molybdate transport system substrate-binding protein